MTGYLGTTARMVPVAPASAQSEARPERFVVQQAASRRWAFDTAQRGGVQGREWAVELSLLDAAEMSAVDEFVQGAWGPGPFRWVSCAAHDSNVLTPGQSILASLDAGSGMDTASGWSPRSVLGPSPVKLAERVPVIPGKPVTVAVDATGSATLTVVFRNAAGGIVSTQARYASGTLAQRLVFSAPSVLSTARSVDVEVSGHVRAARPQVTWTREARPWVPGRGAEQVVIQSGVADPVVINPAGGYWSGSLSLIEVG
ncbi:hypothetical protein ABZ546_14445 [Brachybacterium paraconglomeratum]